MTLKNCRECGTQVSDQAKVCPQCGAKAPIKRISMLSKISIGVVGFIVFATFLPRLASHNDSSPTTKVLNGTPASTQATDHSSAIPPVPPPAAPWQYEAHEDDMRKGINRIAYVKSSNTFSFDWPYSGPQHATLLLRKHVRFGKDVTIQIARGQFVCGVESCSVTVRFDNEAGIKFTASESSDLSTTLLFISPFDAFYTAMLKSQRVRIEANFYQEGRQTADFDVSGFDPKRF